MSSWYVFSALGLYPFSPADAHYIVTVPLFDDIKWTLDNGKVLHIKKMGPGRNMKSITINKTELQGYFIDHDAIKNGAEIVIETK
jgi:putative alpha-1,2-mannosidase